MIEVQMSSNAPAAWAPIMKRFHGRPKEIKKTVKMIAIQAFADVQTLSPVRYQHIRLM